VIDISIDHRVRHAACVCFCDLIPKILNHVVKFPLMRAAATPLGVAVLCALIQCAMTSPIETHLVVADFHESMEMIVSSFLQLQFCKLIFLKLNQILSFNENSLLGQVGFPAGNDYVMLKNGLEVSDDTMTQPPMLGDVCGARKNTNFTMVALDADDAGHQR
jgi:hypothetical protein